MSQEEHGVVRHGETWIGAEYYAYSSPTGAPSSSLRRGKVRFPDGRLGVVKLGVADTYISIPAIPVAGKRRKGYVTVLEDADGEPEFCFLYNGLDDLYKHRERLGLDPETGLPKEKLDPELTEITRNVTRESLRSFGFQGGGI